MPNNLILDEDCDLFDEESESIYWEDQEEQQHITSDAFHYLPGETMIESLPVVRLEDPNEEVDRVDVDKNIWDVPIREDIVHRVVCWQRANWRQGTSKTKSRGEVRGGGRKPWVQKGTGRARHGSIRSPIWRGGGHANAKRPKDWSHKLNRKVLKMGLRVALAAKCREGNLVVVDRASLTEPKTSEISRILDSHGLVQDVEGAVLIGEPLDENFELASRNIPSRIFLALSAADLIKESNVYDIVLRERLIVTRDAFNYLQESLGE